LIDRLTAAVRLFFGVDPKTSADYGRIVNIRHWERLNGLLDAGGYRTVACGGDGDRERAGNMQKVDEFAYIGIRGSELDTWSRYLQEMLGHDHHRS
jgi:hypothetical protein